MTVLRDFRFEGDAVLPAEQPPPSEAGEGAAEPKVFVRTISTPPAWPWNQRRAAELEARHGAPLPLADVAYRLQRLEDWRPGSVGRYAAFYVLASEVGGRLDATAEVEGRTIAVTFAVGAHEAARAGRAAAGALAAAAVVVLIVWSVGAALARRGETAAALNLAEQHADSRLRRLDARHRLADEGRLLEGQTAGGFRLSRVLSDLAWVSGSKVSDARIEALHWDLGYMAVETRGESSPFELLVDRKIRRSAKPLRPGVWLWGVDPSREDAGPAAPQADRVAP